MTKLYRLPEFNYQGSCLQILKFFNVFSSKNMEEAGQHELYSLLGFLSIRTQK